VLFGSPRNVAAAVGLAGLLVETNARRALELIQVCVDARGVRDPSCLGVTRRA